MCIKNLRINTDLPHADSLDVPDLIVEGEALADSIIHPVVNGYTGFVVGWLVINVTRHFGIEVMGFDVHVGAISDLGSTDVLLNSTCKYKQMFILCVH
jgi:hypothetical protein